MLGLPQSTEFGKRIPKQKFYENITVSPALERVFIEQVKTIYWRNKIASSTINLAAGTEVTEIEVFEIRLNQPYLDEGFFRQMDKEIPYHILFLVEYSGKYQAWIGYKESTSGGSNAFKVNRYYHTGWMTEGDLPIKIDGMSIDAVYENFVRQIAGGSLQAAEPSETLKESVVREEQRQRLKKRIATLQKKIRKEKQLNWQMRMNAELKRLRKELEEL